MKRAMSNSDLVIDISAPCRAWRKRLPALSELCRSAAAAAVGEAAPTLGAAELSFLFTDDAAMRVLNRDFRNQDKPTNVLAFPSGAPAGAAPLLGDVAL